MDFLDYQIYSVTNTAKNIANGSDLPEPSSRLHLSTYEASASQDNDIDNTKISDMISGQYGASKTTSQKILLEDGKLYNKMSEYVQASLQSINKNEMNISDNSIMKLQDITPGKQKVSDNIKQIVSDRSSKDIDATDTVLSKKLSKILNDYSFSNYHSTSQVRNSLKVLESDNLSLQLDEKKLISPEYVGILARKSLRSDLETELLKEHLVVLEEFKPIARRVKRLVESVESIKKLGTSLVAEDEQEQETEDDSILKKVAEPQAKISDLLLKKKLLCLLKDNFTLSQVEEDILNNGTISAEFFDVINKVLKIKETSMLFLDLPNKNVGQSLIKKYNRTLELINKKLYYHLTDFLYSYQNSSGFNQNVNDPTESILINFQRSLIYLSNDVEYFNELLKRVTTVRSKSILDDFLSHFDANPKKNAPIILSAHNPVRYVGDILANIYALIVNENDFLQSLFKFQHQHMDNTPVSILQTNNAFLNGIDQKLLNDVVQSLANSFRIRIEQIVRFEENPCTNFEIIHHLELYKMMFEKQGLNEDNPLILNLANLMELAKEKIIECFTKLLKEVDVKQSSVSDDLLPPEWLASYLSKMIELFEIYEQNTTEESRKNNFLINFKFLELLIRDPIQNVLMIQLQNAFPSAKTKQEPKISLLTAKINCFDLLSSRFQPFLINIFSNDEESQNLLKWMNESKDEYVQEMLKLQINLVFQRTGLEMYSNLINMIFPIDSIQNDLDYDMYFSLLDNPLMELDTINNNVHEKLNDYIPRALTDLQENLLFKLTSPSIADTVCDSSFNTLSKFYNIFRKMLLHLYPDDTTKVFDILNFTEEEFNTLIGISDI